MIQRVLETIKEHGMLSCGDKVIAAVSGGADSVGLLVALCELRETLGIEVFAANLNHNIRGKDGDDDTEYVKSLSEKLNVKLFLKWVDIPSESKRDGIGEEECGRRERYAFFDECSRKTGGAKIATGHHMGDNAETVLFHLMRGSGDRGLAGISYVRGNIIRPLLDVKKEDIEKFLVKRGIEWRIDKTNFDTEYARNRIRHNILPQMEAIFPGATEKICRAASLISSDKDALWREALDSDAFDGEKLIAEKLKNLHESIKKRVVINALEHWGIKDADYNKITCVLNLAEGRTGRRLDIGKGIVIANDYGKTGLAAENKKKEYFMPVKTGENAQAEFSGNVIEVKTVDKCEKMSDNNMIAVYDADRLGDFEIRTRRSGDYIYLQKTGLRKKLKELFIDLKVAREKRDTMLIAAKGQEVLFVPGLRVSKRYAPQKDTVRYVILSYKEIKGSDRCE